jgi:hypothetical protein
MKADGSVRTMVCIPYDKLPIDKQLSESNRSRKTHPTLVTAYEEGVGWRSFHSTSVISYEVIE